MDDNIYSTPIVNKDFKGLRIDKFLSERPDLKAMIAISPNSSYIYKENLKNVGYMISQIASGSNVGVARAGVLAAASVIMFSIPCAVFLMHTDIKVKYT